MSGAHLYPVGITQLDSNVESRLLWGNINSAMICRNHSTPPDSFGCLNSAKSSPFTCATEPGNPGPVAISSYTPDFLATRYTEWGPTFGGGAGTLIRLSQVNWYGLARHLSTSKKVVSMNEPGALSSKTALSRSSFWSDTSGPPTSCWDVKTRVRGPTRLLCPSS